MNASTLQVTVTARQPLALGTAAEVSFLTESHDFVPGSVLRGALAAAWIAEFGPPTLSPSNAAEFGALFDAAIRYGPLYQPECYRRPLSVFRCKYPTTDRCTSTVVDAAFTTLAPCPGCRRRLVQSKGELVMPEQWRTQRTIRTAIDPKTSQARDGALYARDALPAGTVLTGLIHGHHPWLARARTLRLGGRRSVGGAADYTTTSALPPPPAAIVDGRLVLRLTGPAIFVDVAGRPRLAPDRHLDLGGAHIERSWTRETPWTGWHAASALPKPPETCAAAGSTYVITGAPQVLADLAHRAIRDGLGLRRTEGFGTMEIVTQAWQPPANLATDPAGAAPEQSDLDPDLRRRHQDLVSLPIDAPQRRWLLGVLRELQIRPQPLADEVLTDLLDQPTAEHLHGTLRDRIREAVTGLDPQRLRDLTILVTDDHRYRMLSTETRETR